MTISEKCSREEYYEYHKSLLMKFDSYYKNVFDSWATNYKFSYRDLKITIIDHWWNNNVVVSNESPGEYIIKISRGIFERLSHIVRLMMHTDLNAAVMITEVFEDVWKNPYFSFYDEFERIDFYVNNHAKPLFHNYGEDSELYNNDFNKYLCGYWPAGVLNDFHCSIPFLWVLDFLIYHEMSHILLRHFELLKNRSNKTVIREFRLANNEPFYERHLIELHADIQAAFMAVQTLDEFKNAIAGKELTDKMRQNMFNFAFLIMIYFSICGKTRASYSRYQHLPHPHPDFRKIFLLDSVSNCLIDGTIYSDEWTKQFKKAFYSIQSSFNSIGASGLGNSLLNPSSPAILSQHGPEKLTEWQNVFFKELFLYKHELARLVQYFSDYDATIKSVRDLDLKRDQIEVQGSLDMGVPKGHIHMSFSTMQFTEFLYKYHSSK